MAILVVAEKPSVARDIARVLKANTRGEGCLSGGGYIVTWALGHLVGICDPGEINEAWKHWRRDTLPMLPERLPTKVLPSSAAQFNTVKKLMLSNDVTELICATDSGREGELIFRLVYQQAGCRKPFRRLWISSMTDAAIKEGFDDLRPSSEYDALYTSARCRSEADWLVGMNASRAYTIKYGALLSLGRVQTPTLALIVRRDNEIEAFSAREYWELICDFGDYTGKWIDPKTEADRSYDKEALEKIRDRVKGRQATVTEVKREEKTARPPQLYDLTTIQREANTRYGYSAKKTLDIVQSLYEKHKLVTYPRTDSRCLPNDMKPKITGVLKNMEGDLAGFAQRLLPDPPTPKRVYDNSKISDHHAIVPTGVRASTKQLTQDEGRIFDMISRRLVAALYPDHKYLSTRVTTECEGETFRSSGTVPTVPGWKEVYGSDKDEKKDENEQLLPAGLKKGDTRGVTAADIAQKKEKPPPRLTAASLLGQMENAGKDIDNEELREAMKDSGLGTPATRAAIIERLEQVGYIKTQGKSIVSTDKGRRLIGVVPPEMTSAETTGRWERALNKMAKASGADEAERLYLKFMDSIRRYSAFLVGAADNADPNAGFEREPFGGGRRGGASAGKGGGTKRTYTKKGASGAKASAAKTTSGSKTPAAKGSSGTARKTAKKAVPTDDVPPWEIPLPGTTPVGGTDGASGTKNTGKTSARASSAKTAGAARKTAKKAAPADDVPPWEIPLPGTAPVGGADGTSGTKTAARTSARASSSKTTGTARKAAKKAAPDAPAPDLLAYAGETAIPDTAAAPEKKKRAPKKPETPSGEDFEQLTLI